MLGHPRHRKLRAAVLAAALLSAVFALNAISMWLLPLEKAGWLFGIVSVDLALLVAIGKAVRPLFISPSPTDFVVDGKWCPPSQPIVRREPDSNEFIGRTRILAALTGAYRSDDDAVPRVRVLVGSFGVGKTRIAQEFALSMENSGVEVWWVSCHDQRMFRCSMCQVALNLGVPREDLAHSNCAAPLVFPRIVRHYRGRSRRWLLVIDNADNLRFLGTPGERRSGTGWVSDPGKEGMILVTSRDADRTAWNGRWVTLHRVKRLDEPLGVKMFESLVLSKVGSSRFGTRREAAHLAGQLGYLPLALRVAGNYFSDIVDHVPGPDLPARFVDYGDAVEGGKGILGTTPIDVTFEDTDKDTLYSCWDISLRLLEAEGLSSARRLLGALARVRTEAIDYEVINSSLFAKDSAFKALRDPRALETTIRRLRDLGLIERRREAGQALLTVPPVTRELAKIDPKLKRSGSSITVISTEIELRIVARRTE